MQVCSIELHCPAQHLTSRRYCNALQLGNHAALWHDLLATTSNDYDNVQAPSFCHAEQLTYKTKRWSRKPHTKQNAGHASQKHIVTGAYLSKLDSSRK